MDENIELVRELNGVKYFCNIWKHSNQTVALLEALIKSYFDSSGI